MGLEPCIKSAQMARLLCEVAIEIGFTIGTLCDLDKINELKTNQRFPKDCNQSILELFYSKVREQILNFKTTTKSAECHELDKNDFENKTTNLLDQCDANYMNQFENSSTVFQWLVFIKYYLRSIFVS